MNDPISSTQKERLGIGELPVPSDSAPDVPPEIKELGVEGRHETQSPILTDAKAAEAGIELAKESTQHSTTPSGLVILSQGSIKASAILKAHKKVTESIVWLATLILKQFKRMEPSQKGV